MSNNSHHNNTTKEKKNEQPISNNQKEKVEVKKNEKQNNKNKEQQKKKEEKKEEEKKTTGGTTTTTTTTTGLKQQKKKKSTGETPPPPKMVTGRYNISREGKKNMGLKPTRDEKECLNETIETYCATGDREKKRVAITDCLESMQQLPEHKRSRAWDYHKVRKYVNNHTLRREEFSVMFHTPDGKKLSEEQVNHIIKKRKRSITSKIPEDVKEHIVDIKDDKSKINKWLRDNYYYYSNKELAKVLNVQPSTIVKRARKAEKINIAVETKNMCCARSCVTNMSPQQISQHFNAIWSESNETTRRKRVIAMLREFKQNSSNLPCIRFCKQVFLISHQMRTRCINEDKGAKLTIHGAAGGMTHMPAIPYDYGMEQHQQQLIQQHQLQAQQLQQAQLQQAQQLQLQQAQQQLQGQNNQHLQPQYQLNNLMQLNPNSYNYNDNRYMQGGFYPFQQHMIPNDIVFPGQLNNMNQNMNTNTNNNNNNNNNPSTNNSS